MAGRASEPAGLNLRDVVNRRNAPAGGTRPCEEIVLRAVPSVFRGPARGWFKDSEVVSDQRGAACAACPGPTPQRRDGRPLRKQHHGPGRGRRTLTLLPDQHICVDRSDQIAPDVTEALSRLDLYRSLSLVSGPPATSDIEPDRVKDVHGPRHGPWTTEPPVVCLCREPSDSRRRAARRPVGGMRGEGQDSAVIESGHCRRDRLLR
ncbi:LUD domain-containing protein [Streptomyces lincolnensis]|uniref:LUD domain-containing protein n=1 Tax=Streptomyces lincolnensis TaxID=1915 RepID=UPI0009A0A6B8|nr:LUD domain-containing protein [Streptomyces lincolnensis]QMV04864.1 hypothetical protein GJU35_03805 [Streptomyces lincolnensis]